MATRPPERPAWVGRTAVCIASGPSLTDEQLGMVGDAHAQGGVRVIGVNNAYLRAPWLDVIFACDSLWWRKHIGVIRQRMLAAELVTQDNVAAKAYDLTRVRGANRPGLGTYEIHTGGNGGFCAVNLAYLWGARRIVLLGYDMQLGPKGERHWHADHPAPMVQMQLFDEWRKRFDVLATDLRRHGAVVLNATPGSALECFPRADLAQALEMVEA